MIYDYIVTVLGDTFEYDVTLDRAAPDVAASMAMAEFFKGIDSVSFQYFEYFAPSYTFAVREFAGGLPKEGLETLWRCTLEMTPKFTAIPL